MPYSQTHLLAASQILDEPSLHEPASWLFADPSAQAAFLYGAIAPDAHIFTDQPRESTHFFTIPPQPAVTSPMTMFKEWPSLANPESLSPRSAALVAGYLTHLVMDEVWVEDVVLPYIFIEDALWGPEHPGWDVYQILIAYLEYHAVQQLSKSTLNELRKAEVGGILPFLPDYALTRWRDRIASQILDKPHGTLDLLSERCQIEADQLVSLLTSEQEMGKAAYTIVPRESLDKFQRNSARHILNTVLNYAAGNYTHP